jgi:8-oxo-dGTP diphosphatase
MSAQKINSKAKGNTIVSCANILVKMGDAYVVLKRSEKKEFAPNVIAPFGGKISRGESPLKAAIRELKEESGLTAKNIKLRAIVTETHNDPDMLGDWLVYYFIGDYDKGEIIKTPEGTTLKLTSEELKKHELFPTFKVLLPYLLKEEIHPIIAQITFDKNRELVTSSVDVC